MWFWFLFSIYPIRSSTLIYCVSTCICRYFQTHQFNKWATRVLVESRSTHIDNNNNNLTYYFLEEIWRNFNLIWYRHCIEHTQWGIKCLINYTYLWWVTVCFFFNFLCENIESVFMHIFIHIFYTILIEFRTLEKTIDRSGILFIFIFFLIRIKYAGRTF